MKPYFKILAVTAVLSFAIQACNDNAVAPTKNGDGSGNSTGCRLKHTDRKDGSGEVKSSRGYVYNEKNNLEEMKYYRNDDFYDPPGGYELYTSDELTLDANGRIIRVARNDSNWNDIIWDGNKISKIKLTGKAARAWTREYTFVYNGDKLDVVKYIDDGKPERILYEVTWDGENISQIISRREGGILSNTINYTDYDDKPNVVGSAWNELLTDHVYDNQLLALCKNNPRRYDYGEPQMSFHDYTYEYDSKGNVTKRTQVDNWGDKMVYEYQWECD